MSSVSITDRATEAIVRRCNDPAAQGIIQGRPIPLLLWTERSYFDDDSGKRTEFGSKFYFYSTNYEEIRKYNYLTLDITGENELALAPGELFRTGSHKIDLQGDKLILVS